MLEQLHPLMQIFLLFCTKKAIFSILHTYFYKTPTSVYLLYTLFSLNNRFIIFFFIISTSSLVNPTFTLFFSKHYSLSLSLTRWIFFLFLLSLIFLHRSNFLLLPLSLPKNSINKPKNFTSTQTHVNLIPFGLDLAMATRQMRRRQQGICGGNSKVDLAAAKTADLTNFHWVFHVGLCWIFHMGFPLDLVFIDFGLDLEWVFRWV